MPSYRISYLEIRLMKLPKNVSPTLFPNDGEGKDDGDGDDDGEEDCELSLAIFSRFISGKRTMKKVERIRAIRVLVLSLSPLLQC